jgi:hypothetical protein
MATIKSGSEGLKKAIAWISEQRKDNPQKDVAQIAQEANIRFDLNPEDSEFVLRFVKDPDSYRS